jgi:hypothetical protein
MTSNKPGGACNRRPVDSHNSHKLLSCTNTTFDDLASVLCYVVLLSKKIWHKTRRPSIFSSFVSLTFILPTNV